MNGELNNTTIQLMIDIFEIQCSINRALSSILGFKGSENEIDSLKSLCLALESLKLNKNSFNNAGLAQNEVEYDKKEDFYQFLDNLRRLMELFANRLVHFKSLDSQLSHLYIKIFLNITNTLKNNYYEFQYDVLSIPLLKIWCEVICFPGSNRIDQDTIKKNHHLFIDYIPLLLSTYKCAKPTEDLNRLLFVILEILRSIDDEESLRQILEGLEVIPESLDFQGFVTVYPGVISKLFNKLEDLNLILFSKAIDVMIVWFRYFLDNRKEVYNSKIKQFNSVLKCVDNKEEILEKTEKSIKMIIKRFKNTKQQSVGILCIKCMEYEFLDNNLRYMMAECILESITKKEILSQFKENMNATTMSFNLILRDIVTSSINENNDEDNRETEEKDNINSNKDKDKYNRYNNYNNTDDICRGKGLKIFNSYLVLREYLPLEIDHYLVLKFLINNVQIDFTGVNEKLVLNKKYLVDTPNTVQDKFLEKNQKIETFSSKYFNTLTNELKLDSVSNLLSVYKNSNNLTVNLNILHLMNEIVNTFSVGCGYSKFSEGSSVDYEGFWELKSILVTEKMFKHVNCVEDLSLVNLTKIKIMDLLTILIKNSKRGDLTHKDIECILFNVIPEYNSDYVKVYQSSTELLSELSSYFSKYINNNSNKNIIDNFNKLSFVENEHEQSVEHDQQAKENKNMIKDDESMQLSNLLEYYTNGLIKRIIYSIGNEEISDLVYSLTNFNNRSLDMKIIFDLTVQFCKYFDTVCQGLPEYDTDVIKNSIGKDIESNYSKLVKIFYCFNYILMFVYKFFNKFSKLENNNNSNRDNRIKDKYNKDNNNNNTYSQDSDNKDNNNFEDDEDGKGDYILSTSTLMITRARYYVFSKNTSIKYLALLALYRGLITVSSNEYIFRIRVHEVWDCISHALEVNLNQLRVLTVLLEIFQLIAMKIFYFIEKRLLNIFEILEQIVLNEEQVVGVADERNSTVRYKCYLAIVKFTEEISNRVNNRNLFSKIMLISIKIHNPKTCVSIKEKINKIFINLSKKDPTFIRNVLLEINKGESMNTSFIKYAFKIDIKTLFNKIPPQRIILDLPIIN